MKNTVGKFLFTIERVEMVIAKIFIAIMIFSVAMQVFFRHIFNRPLPWPEELSGFLIIWITFLVADVLFKRKGHVKVDYFYKKLKPKVQEVVTFIINLFIMVFLFFLILSSIQLASTHINHLVGASLRLSRSLYTLPAIISGISMFFSAFYEQWEAIDRFRTLEKK